MLRKLKCLPLLLLMLLQFMPSALQPAPRAAGTVASVSSPLQQILSGLGATPAQAATWQVLDHDTFTRPTTSTGSAGNQTSVGQNWIDTLGSVWRINANQLYGIGSTTQGNTLLRPVSEKQAEQRIAVTRVQAANVEAIQLVAREQADTSRYAVILSGTTFRLNRVSAANASTQLVNLVLTQGPVIGNNITLDFQVTTSAGNAVVAATYTNNSTGDVQTITSTDSGGSKITSAGQCGIDISTAGNFAFSEAWVYYDNTSSATISPSAVQSGVTNTTLSLVGTGTSWVSGTTFTLTASGSNGAALGTVTWTDSTHISVVLSNSGSVNDSLLIKDNTSGTLTVVGVTAPVISASPGQLITSTSGNTIKVVGNVQTWSTSAPSFTVSGVSGISITNTTVTSNTTATITVTTGSATGTVTLSDTNASFAASTTFAVNYAIKVSDPNVYLSPYTWDVNGSLYADSNYAGAYVHVKFTTTATGPINILYDATPNIVGSLASSNYPTIGWVVNPTSSGNKWQYQQLGSNTGSVTVNASAVAGTYDLTMYVKSIRAGASDTGRWNPSARKFRFLGIQVDPSATTVSVTPRSKNIIVYGDSITQGVGTLGITSSVNDDAYNCYVRSLADGMGAEYGDIGLSGQEWSSALTATLPPAFYSSSNTPADTASYYEAGRSRLVSGHLSPVPDYVFVNEGTNDGISSITNIAANVQGTLTTLRSITSPTTPIFLIMPFGGFVANSSTGIPGGLTNYKAANPNDSHVFLIDTTSLYPTAGMNNTTGASENNYTFDGLHLKRDMSLSEGAAIAKAAQAALAAALAVGRGIHAGGHFNVTTPSDLIFRTIKTYRRTY